ncbi:hypothetical protein FHX81_0634 [Saccharothrix saharensis]|uniref:Uncharacterized protein n=1 Tax=Saccharothrix saharensis TaxID=571190 RepID=A0A543J6F1_9PSEU|nr:hypothetical protein [Saccharothrix saharensis]TQM78368.1 hypothetical protein FHX81_0634 [Saccharothrix saharensis]
MEATRDPIDGDERAELHWLRKENAFLRVQLDVLTDIATGYARDVDRILRLRARG